MSLLQSDILTYMLLVLKLAFFLIITSFIFYAWLLYWRKYHSSAIDRLLAALIATLGQIIFSTLLFGIIGKYQVVYLAGFNVLMSGFIVSRNREHVSILKQEFRQGFAAILHHKIVLALGIITIFFIFWQAWLAFYSAEIGFDANVYHLPWAATLVQEQYIGLYSTPVPWVSLYPKNAEIWSAWYLLFVRDGRFIDIVQIVFWAMAGLSVFSLSQKMKRTSNAGFVAASIFLSTPLVLLQLRSNYIDLAMAALFLALLNISWTAQFTKSHWTLWSMTAGILLGMKATAILWIVVVFCVLLLRHKNIVKQYWLSGLLLITVFGGYWYLQNWIIFGSPLHPIRISVGSWTVFPGLLTIGEMLVPQNIDAIVQQSYWAQLWWNLTHKGLYLFDMNHGGYGIVWSVLLLPLSIVYGIVAFIKKRNQELLLLFILGSLWLLTPSSYWLRYVLFVPAIGALALAWLWDQYDKLKYIIGIFCAIYLVYNIAVESSTYKIVQWNDVYSENIKKLQEYQSPGTTIAYDSGWFKIWPLWNHTLSNRVIHIYPDNEWKTKLGASTIDTFVTSAESTEFQWMQDQTLFHLDNDGEHYALWRRNK